MNKIFEIFRKYRASFFVGLGGGLFLILGSAWIAPFGNLTDKVYNFINLAIPILKEGILGEFISLFIISLPLFIASSLFIGFRKNFGNLSDKIYFFFFSLVFFFLGVLLSFSLFIVLIAIAISQWHGPSF